MENRGSKCLWKAKLCTTLPVTPIYSFAGKRDTCVTQRKHFRRINTPRRSRVTKGSQVNGGGGGGGAVRIMKITNNFTLTRAVTKERPADAAERR